MSKDMTAAHDAARRAAETRKQTMAERVQAILAHPYVSDELKRKLKYCQDEIAKGRDGGLSSTRGKLIAEASRQHPEFLESLS